MTVWSNPTEVGACLGPGNSSSTPLVTLDTKFQPSQTITYLQDAGDDVDDGLVRHEGVVVEL